MEIIGSVRLRRPISVLVLALLLAILAQFASADAPRGVFSLSISDVPAAQAVFNNPDVDGISVRVGWAEIEPTEGNFNWSFVDSELARAAAAGKMVMLRIGTQNGKPQWVTDAVTKAGGAFFTFQDDGVTNTIPVFWDPTYLAKKKAMIAAVGAHLKNNPTVKIVTASFANATSEDWNVPHTPDYVTQWLSVGYTSDRMLDAGKQTLDATMAAFPNASIALAVAGDGNALDPDTDYVARNAILTARSSWPGRLVVQKNCLSTFNAPAPGTGSVFQLLWDSRPDVAAQMLSRCSNEPTYRMNGGIPADPATILHTAVNAGLAYGTKYLEIYQADVVALPTEIHYAHNALLSLPNSGGSPPTAPTGLSLVQ